MEMPVDSSSEQVNWERINSFSIRDSGKTFQMQINLLLP